MTSRDDRKGTELTAEGRGLPPCPTLPNQRGYSQAVQKPARSRNSWTA